MGVFNVELEIGDIQRQRWVKLEAMVDTGAGITAIPASVLRGLGVEPLWQQRFQFAQGEVREMDVGEIAMRLEGKEFPTQVLFNEEGTLPLLGAMALEGGFFGVDPHNKRLMPIDGLML